MSAASDQWAPYVDSTFSFAIDAVNHHLLQERQMCVLCPALANEQTGHSVIRVRRVAGQSTDKESRSAVYHF